MPKGYWIARVDVHDPETYKKYVEANGPVFAKYEAKFLVRSGQYQAPEGYARSRNVVIEFKDYETAQACYNSPEYAAAKEIRESASLGEVLIIEGYDGPQSE
jgi:uncharacterized protein (DUF1330 family)